MTISWVNSDGKEGIAENDYEFAMQHQMADAQAISDVVPRRQEDLSVSGTSEYKSSLRQLNEALDITNVIKPPGPMTGSVSQDMLGSIPMSMSGLRPVSVRLTPVTSPRGMDWNRLQINGQYARHQVPMTGVGHVHPAVEQFGPIIATQLGSQYLYDHPEQAQKIMDNIITAAGAADLELTPQSRIDQSFSDIPKKKYDDQNNPLTWGLGEINKNIQSDMQDPGPKQRQENIQQELDSGIARIPLERQIQATKITDVNEQNMFPKHHGNVDLPDEAWNYDMNKSSAENKEAFDAIDKAIEDFAKSKGMRVEDQFSIFNRDSKQIEHYRYLGPNSGGESNYIRVDPVVPSDKISSLERQIQARRSGAVDSEDVSTYDHPVADRESRMYLNEMYSKFKKQPLEGPHKNLTEQEYKDLLWDTPIASSKGGRPSAADIQEMLDVTDEEHKAHYDEAVKQLGKDNVIGGINPSGRIRMRKDSEGYQEYIKNIPDDVSVHDMGDGSVILRKKPAGTPPVVGSLQDELGDPSQIPTSTYQQFADYVHDLRVKFTGEPDKWSGKEIVGDFLDKAMSVMGAGMRIPKVPFRTGTPVAKSAAQEAFDAKVASGKKIGAADYPHVQEEFLKAINEGVTGADALATRLRLSDAQVRAVAKATDVNLNDFRTSWNERNTQQLKDMISEGKTYAEIAKELGVSRGAVGGKVDRLGLEIQNDQSTGAGKRNVPKIYTDELRDKIRVMYAKGKTSAEIAEEIGLNAATLRFQTAKHKLRK